LIQNWIAGREVLEFEHYPPDDLVDVRKGSQFYYHAHRDGDQEHGHLHLFWHATATGRRRYLKPGQPRWNRTEPTHLFAISLDAGFVRLYRPLINDLLMRRDRRMARRSDLAKALQDRDLEVLSLTPIDWIADMDALEAEAVRRGL